MVRDDWKLVGGDWRLVRFDWYLVRNLLSLVGDDLGKLWKSENGFEWYNMNVFIKINVDVRIMLVTVYVSNNLEILVTVSLH